MENKPSVLTQNYELGRLLGQGTFAKVYYARSIRTNESVAIKVIDKEKLFRVGLVDHIKREISIMRIIRHPNIVQLYEVLATKSKIFVVMEYAKGGELFNKVAKGRLKEDDARKYFLQLINAVDFCHSRGVYHRDIKPENLLLDENENENLKVTDFGLSALAESKREDGLLHTTCGTPAYVAPEVINKKGYDGAKADVWSCGVLLYVLLAGYIPFHDSNLMEMYRRIGKAEFKCPIWFPPEVRRLLRKILDPNPDTRITIAKIKGSSWCRQGLSSKRGKTETESCTAALVNDNDSGPSEHNNKDIDTKLESVKPSNLNAFDIISFSAGFDLSGLFEEKPLKREARFTSMQPASVIISKLEAIARRLKLKVMKKDKGLLKLEGLKEGRKGPLSIDAEIFEVTPNFHLVEVKKSSGDTLEYQKIIKEDVRPALKDIVWVWHGDQEHHEQQSPQQEELREQAIVRIRWCGNSSLSVLFSDGMADLFTYWKPERDIEQALIALKKGTSLVKYSRKGKPKFRAFRLSHDETTLIWLSHGQEKNLKLSSISRIIPGQRTAVFRRYLRPEKDYLSFSLLYYDGERSLDLICKDKVEAEVWLAGLSSLIGKSNNRHTKSDIFDLTGEGDIFSNSRPFVASLEFSSSINRPGVSVDIGPPDSSSSDAGTDRTNMQIRGSTDGFRISVSSSPSCSSGGSGPDDIESLGDVYIWGGIWSDGVLSDGSASSITTRNDMLTPKALESNVVLDVHQIACGVHHISLVTRQGEVFTWGEESGGRLGHGIGNDCIQPRLVETLALNNIEFVACGEYHTCAVSAAGDLFTWGDGTRNNGLLGHGTDASHWIPKRVSTPLDGLQVLSIACGSWHSALATSDGKLFTFGDGTFGVLGHGDRESVSYPKEIQSLSGLKTIKVACGLWHTAAIVEVMGQSSNVLSRKLFTWGDGGKNRLGHGNRDAYLFPTCVSSLIDYNFHQLACGHTLTVGLTTSGHVFTMGGSSYGQLGNPNSDGRSPCLVQDRLVGEFVEEISCGAYHVAVLTSRSELFTWGRGANGQLGHGDTEDRKTPTLVETLKDRHVKNISCGSNFTSCICLHKWVSGADQSVCSGCRQAFGFTRKRHNCYNCGLVHCHACSSKKAMKAALAPTPGKPHRVCDGCYAKLKAAEAGNPASITRKATAPRYSVDMRERLDRGELKSSRILLSPILAPVKYLEIKSGIHGGKSASMARASQVPSVLQLKDIAFPSTLGGLQYGLKPSSTPTPPPPPPPPQPQPLHLPLSISISPPNSRSCSPYSRRPSPQRSSTPAFSRSVIDSLKKTNELLKQDMSRMQNQIKSLKQKSDVQDMQIQKLQEQAKEAANFGTAESSKCRLAVEFVKSITHQMKEMTEQLPTEVQENESLKSLHAQMEAFVITKEMQSSSIPESLDAFDAHDMPEQRMEEQAADGMRASDSSHDFASASTPPGTSAASRGGGHKEMTEQFEPGVYVTYIQRSSGAKIYKRVKFSKRKFKEQEANEWWKVNKERLLRRYNPPVKSTAPGPGPSSTPGTSSSTSVPAEDNSEEAEPSES